MKPWIDSVNGNSVRFSDGTTESFDAILFGTVYHLNLPFLSEDIRRTLDADTRHIDLYKHTLHPELPGLAFVGLFELIGPYYPVLELQARWIAYTFRGAQPAPARDDQAADIAAYRARRGGPQTLMNHTAAALFARAAGVEPELERWPELARPLLFGPLTPTSFRMSGRDSLPDAPQRFAAEVQLFGCMPSNELPPPSSHNCRHSPPPATMRHSAATSPPSLRTTERRRQTKICRRTHHARTAQLRR